MLLFLPTVRRMGPNKAALQRSTKWECDVMHINENETRMWHQCSPPPHPPPQGGLATQVNSSHVETDHCNETPSSYTVMNSRRSTKPSPPPLGGPDTRINSSYVETEHCNETPSSYSVMNSRLFKCVNTQSTLRWDASSVSLLRLHNLPWTAALILDFRGSFPEQ